MADRVMAPSQEELQSFRYLRELLLNVIREIERGDLTQIQWKPYPLGWIGRKV